MCYHVNSVKWWRVFKTHKISYLFSIRKSVFKIYFISGFDWSVVFISFLVTDASKGDSLRATYPGGEGELRGRGSPISKWPGWEHREKDPCIIYSIKSLFCFLIISFFKYALSCSHLLVQLILLIWIHHFMWKHDQFPVGVIWWLSWLESKLVL